MVKECESVPALKIDNYFDYLEQYLAPYAIKCGQTAQEFWFGSPSFTWQYIIAYRNSEKERAEYEDAMLHRAALYNYLAVSQCFTKKKVFPQKPFGIKKSEETNNLTPEQSNAAWFNYLSKKLS